jgi:choline-sulfatase
VLEATRQDAMVLFLSDHGEMSDERGLWFRMNVVEGPARLPPMIAAPGLAPRRIDAAVARPTSARRLSTLPGWIPLACHP